MPKLPIKITRTKVNGLMRFWKEAHSLSVNQITTEAEQSFSLALVGGEDQTSLLAARLALETPAPKDGPQGPANIRPFLSFHTDPATVPQENLRLDADVLTADEVSLAQALAQMVISHPELRLALARRIPAFRPAVTAQLIAETSWTNAKIATLSALPGVIPFADVLMPATSVGDMILLTKNQGMMLLRIAAAYGMPIDMRARTRELLPVVGSAFGWRALARELIGLVPGGFGLVLKGSIAYAGTYTVGKAAQIYYSTGHTLTGPRLKQLSRDAAKDARARLRQWLRREKPDLVRRGDLTSPVDPHDRDLAPPTPSPERIAVAPPLKDEAPRVTRGAIDNPVQIGV